MRSDLAIRVENLGKRYAVGAKQEPYGTLRDTLARTATAPYRALRSTLRRRVGGGAPSQSNEIWALKGVSFEVKRGEAVGVIGRNGAGKSTLLKTLSRITEPTTGYADINGRVGSLLEVGTGFHPELTGRENIFLNGAILGMRRAEIMEKFDEIVSFAEVERFIDTPIKYYSSGMHLRLAFAIAAHLEPEILLVDEVLAVGDMAFQKKCMGKMETVTAEGRTVLFVSHNLGAVKELCQTTIVLRDGVIGFHGPVVEAIAYYSRDLQGHEGADARSATYAKRGTRWTGIKINGVDAALSSAINSLEPFTVEARLEVPKAFVAARFQCRVEDSSGNTLIRHIAHDRELEKPGLEAGIHHVRVEFPTLWLVPGIYTLFFRLNGRREEGDERRYTSERVILNVTGKLSGHRRSILSPPLKWSLSHEGMTVKP